MSLEHNQATAWREHVRERLIVALDYPELATAQALVQKLDGLVTTYKLGLQLFTQQGPAALAALRGHRIFLDLKFHDIPNTVASAVTEATRHGVFMLTLHALGGEAMLRAAVDAAKNAAARFNVAAPKLLAVTVLTSHASIAELGISAAIPDAVSRFAELAQRAGCDGVVCSPQELSRLRPQCGTDFLLVTPGIRWDEHALGDQQRIASPQAAFNAGASYIVVGRPITQASDPKAVIEAISKNS